MSRRKQSNPKPIKRLSDGEEAEEEMEDKISPNPETEDEVLMDQSESSNDITSEDRHCKSEVDHHEFSNGNEVDLDKVKHEIPENEKEESAFDRESRNGEQIIETESDKRLNFPSDILLFRKLDETEATQTGREYVVCTAIPLPKHSGLGPFPGELVSLSSIKQGDLVLQAQSESGETQFVRVLDQAGSWLSQLRPAPSEANKNCTVHFQGGKIWCGIVCDVEAEAELMASFTIGSEPEPEVDEPTCPKSESMSPTELIPKHEIKEEVRDDTPVSMKEQTIDPSSSKPLNNHAALLYGCPFCGVRFSSARTLDGHLTYYCSKKPVDFLSVPAVRHDGNKTDETLEESEPENKPSSPTESIEDSNHKLDKSDTSSENASEMGSPVAKSVKTGSIYKCPYCSYTADKMSSLNRHKRIHNRGNNPEELVKYSMPVPKNETYCRGCNIQFSSLNTYKCHREYYCSKRHLSVDTATGSGSDGSPSPQATQTTPPLVGNTSAIFSKNLSSLNPEDLKKVMSVSSASMMSGQTRVLLAPPILAPNGVGDMTMGMPTVIVQPIVAAPSTLTAHQNSVKPTHKKDFQSVEQPLDLSTPRKEDRRKSVEYARRQESPEGSHNLRKEDSNKVKEEGLTPQSSPQIKTPTTPSAESIKSPDKNEQKSPSGKESLPEMPQLLPVHQLPYMCGKPIPPMLQSVSKCSECNIVFYKHENYMIHKKHYCSSRRGKMESPDNYETESSSDSYSMVTSVPVTREDLKRKQGQMLEEDKISEKESTVMEVKSPQLKSPRTENSVPDEVFYKYYCVPCKIKFSSSSTLKAHKEFYCPHGKESAKSVVTKKTLEEISNSPKDPEEGIFKCDRCDSEFVSGRLLKLHFCTGISSATSLLRCPYCEFVTQVENRISEHMKVHMPNKVYRCTLCRYRGNTVRGMRMHGKMHVDNGEDFTDENMIEIEEPPLIPVKMNNSTDTRPVDIETELIRLKNEPYKRRRSRKSFEKSEHKSSITNVCVFCGQVFNDLNSFALHLKIHEMIALQAASARNVKCQYCDSVLDTFEDLMKHIQLKHQDKLMSEQRSPSSQGQSSRSNSRSSLSNSRPGSVDHVDSNASGSQGDLQTSPKMHIKTEPGLELKHNNDSDSPRSSDNIVLVKQEPLDCSSQQPAKSPRQENNSEPKQNDFNIKSENPFGVRPSSINSNGTESSGVEKRSPLSPQKSPISGDKTNSASPNAKTDLILNGARNHSSPTNFPLFDPQRMIPYYQLLPNMQGLSHLVSVSLQNSVSPTRSEKPIPKYCNHCDIKFTYQSSYLAHKRYYCSARTTAEEQTSPVTSAVKGISERA